MMAKKSIKIPEEFQLTQEDITEILTKTRPWFQIVTDIKVVKKERRDYHLRVVEGLTDYRAIPTMKTVCYCDGERNETDGLVCKVCNHGHGMRLRGYNDTTFLGQLKNSDIQKKMEDISKQYPPSLSYHPYIHGLIKTNTIYVKRHPLIDEGLLIYKVSMSVTEEDMPKINITPTHLTKIIPGEGSTTYKINKSGIVEIKDIYAVLNVNSQTMKEVEIIYQNADTMLDFLLLNKKMSQYLGIFECYRKINISVNPNSFFLCYLAIYQYQAIEFIVKMGHMTLIYDIFNQIYSSQNKKEIHNKIARLEALISHEAKNGSEALRMPKWMGDILRDRRAFLDEYLFWCDVYELEGISKETMLNIISTQFYVELNFDTCSELLGYNYPILKLEKYIAKQQKKLNLKYSTLTQLLLDFNRMCDILNITPDKYPSNIESAHDNCAKACTTMKKEKGDLGIKSLAEKAQKYIPNTIEDRESKYFIKIPESTADLMAEAQSQHNCLASYALRISRHETLVFFIREKETPNDSLVTAEYKNGSIRQLYYRNNIPVTNAEIRKLANRFAAALSKTDIVNYAGYSFF